MTDTNTSALCIKNLSTGYKQKKNSRVVAEGLNGSLRIGELTCLLGPNGAGKSTLLRTLAGFQPALSGSIDIMGKPLASYAPKELARLVSIVLTNNSNINNVTAYDVVAMGRSPYTGFWGRLDSKDKHLIDKCFEWVGIVDMKDRKMQTLSDGERQKVMIAKAIAQETPIILLDEPTAFLDYPSKITTMLLLRRLAEALHKAIFVSTHDLEHAQRFADKLWLLDQEHGLTIGTPEALKEQEMIEEYFHINSIINAEKASNPFQAPSNLPPFRGGY